MPRQKQHYNVIIIGAGAAGLMCAIHSSSRGHSVCILEHNPHVGEKIRISGGGRCNFTNIHTSPRNYLSENPHFCTSALSRYRPTDFIALLHKHHISYHEKTLGQLFCDGSSKQIITMLLEECRAQQVMITLGCSVTHVEKAECFQIHTSQGTMSCDRLVVASGGLSIPKLGATGIGYDIARQFGLPVIPPHPALVPLTLGDPQLTTLSGIALETVASTARASFQESMLFTHKGLSGPAILQISSYWQEGTPITLNLLPGIDFYAELNHARHGRTTLSSLLNRHFSKRLAALWAQTLPTKILAEMKASELQSISTTLQSWQLMPTGTEGFQKAEVTRGGVDTRALSSKTMEATSVPGLFFIGEVVDVTGWLGGYNFQWAWASAAAAGAAV